MAFRDLQISVASRRDGSTFQRKAAKIAKAAKRKIWVEVCRPCSLLQQAYTRQAPALAGVSETAAAPILSPAG